jgi:hypothetical protein
MTQLPTPCKTRLTLIQTLTSLSLFTQTLSCACSHPSITLSPEEFSNDLYSLEHALLSFPNTSPSPAHELPLSVPLSVAVLIYLKAILQAFSHFVNGSSILVERLRENLSTIWDDGCKARSLVRWVCIVGAAVAKGELKGWFVEKFGRMDLH